MSDLVVAAILTVTGSFLASIVGSFLVFRVNNKRVPSQNARDDMDTAKIALEISEKATAKQLELVQEVESLKQILKTRHYKVTVVFSLGEIPKIESASVEALTNVRQELITME